MTKEKRNAWLAALALCAWLVIGVFNYGVTMAYFEYHYPSAGKYSLGGPIGPRGRHGAIAAFCAVAGPFALPTVLFTGDEWRGLQFSYTGPVYFAGSGDEESP